MSTSVFDFKYHSFLLTLEQQHKRVKIDMPTPPEVHKIDTFVKKDAYIQSSTKLKFRMGFRQSCWKCRNKVEGHYSHID